MSQITANQKNQLKIQCPIDPMSDQKPEKNEGNVAMSSWFDIEKDK